MPGNVDERVVEMRIDNKQFESGAKTTISTLEKLERALHLKGDSTAIDDMAKSVSNFDASPMTKSIDKVGDHFNALEIAGRRVIENLTDGIYNFATKTVKDLVIEQPKEGWRKYETKAEAVQSIMAATRDMVTGINEIDENGIAVSFATQEDQMAKVNELLEQMNWFTDETSYNFNDMAANVGKFLAAGTGLEDTFTAIMGIASWGGSAGAKPQEVSRAMYNISQAMSSGAMKAIDWKSIENAGMATLEFKQNAIDAAEAMGRLRKVGNNAGHIEEEADAIVKYAAAVDKADEDLKDKEVFDAMSFREGLNSGWFDTEVMMEVFKRYGEFQDKLYAATEATGLEATDVLQLVDKVRDGNKAIDWEKYAHDASMAVDKFKEAIQTVSDVTWEFSENGFRMGQEAKTWTDMIEATKDAVSSEWMKTFQYIFGDYLEAKEFWTEMTGEFWEIFAAGGALRNEILDSWYSSGGRMALFGLDKDNLGAFWNIINSIKTVVGPVHDAMLEAFGLDTEGGIKAVGERLAELTRRFQELTKNIGLSEQAQKGLKNIFSMIFRGAKLAADGVGGILGIFGHFVFFIGEVLDAVLSLASGDVKLAEVQQRVTDAFWDFIEPFTVVINKLKNFDIRSISDSLAKVVHYFEKFKQGWPDNFLENMYNSMNGFEKLLVDAGRKFPFLMSVFSTVKSTIDKLITGMPSFDGALGSVVNWIQQLKNVLKGTKIDLSSVQGILGRAGNVADVLLTALFGDIDVFREKVKTMVTTALNGVLDAIKAIKISDILTAIRIGITAGFLGGFLDIVRSFHMVANEVKSIPEAISDTLGSLQKSFEATSYIKMAVAIGILAASIYALSKVPADDFMRIVLGLGILALVLQKVGKGINIFSGSNNTGDTITKGLKANIKLIPDLAATILALAFAMGVMANAVVSFKKNGIGTGKNGWADLLMPIGTMLITLASILGFLYLLRKYNIKDVGKSFGMLVTLFAVIGRVTSLIKATKNVPWQNILAAMVGMGAVIAAMALTLRFASGFKKFKDNQILHVAAVMLAIGMVISAAGKAVVAIGKMKTDNMVQGMIGVGLLLGAFLGITAIISKFDTSKSANIMKVAGSLALMAVSINLLIVPLMALAALPFWKMIGAVVGLGALLGVLGGALVLMSKMGDANAGAMLKIAGALALMSLGLALVLPSLIAFTTFLVTLAATLSWKMVGKIAALSAAMVLLGAGLLVAGAGIALFGAGMLGVAASALMFSLALLAIASGLDKISTAFPQFVQGLVDAGEMMTEENALNIKKGALAFLALAAAVFVLAIAFGKLFGNGDILAKLGGFGKNLAVGIGNILRNVGSTITSHIPELLKILGAVAVAAGLYMIGIIPKLTSWAVQALITLFESIHQSFRDNKGALEYSIFGMVEVVLEVLVDAGTWLLSVLRGLLYSGVLWLIEQIPGVGEKWSKALSENLPSTDEIMAQWAEQKGSNEKWLQQFLPPPEKLRDSSEKVTRSIGTGVIAGQSSVTEAFGTVRTSIDEAMAGMGENAQLEGGNIIGLFSDGMTDNLALIDGATDAINNRTTGAFKGIADGMAQNGRNVVVGLNNGMVQAANEGFLQRTVNKITGLVNRVTRRGLDEHSPSRIAAEAGAFYIIGLANGIADNAKLPLDAIDDTTDPMVEALKRAMTQVATITDDDFGFSPVITPVVDMSNVNSAAGSMNGLFGGINRVAAVQAERYSSYTPTVTRDNSVVNELQSLSSRMDTLGEAITNMQIVLDTGVLVGATSAKMDARLGVLAARKGRGN